MQLDLKAHHLLDLFHIWIWPFQNGEGTTSREGAPLPPSQNGKPSEEGASLLPPKNGEGSTSEEDASPTLLQNGHEATTSLEEGAPPEDTLLQIIHPAVDLRKAGIHFRHCDIEHTHFEGNSLYLPQISIDDFTETLLRNLIAFEMCKPSQINFVSCYVSLMDDLIDSAEDVALLRRKKIIRNCIGSDTEIAELFNGLCKGVTVGPEDPFHKLKRDVNAYYEDKKYLWFAQLVNEHFSTPWKALALAGAIILLLLSVVQTICSILSVIHDK